MSASYLSSDLVVLTSFNRTAIFAGLQAKSEVAP